jgi:hypothetical protein
LLLAVLKEVWFTQSAGGTDNRTSLSLWWQGTWGSDAVCWEEDDIVDMIVRGDVDEAGIG